MRIVAVTACPTGIAHTYMAADALNKTAPKFNVSLKLKHKALWVLKNLLPCTGHYPRRQSVDRL